MDLAILLMSFLVGMLIGLTSLGGAALMAPFLILVVGVRPVLAVGTDLAYGAVTKIIGAWMHWRQGTVEPKIAVRLASGSVPGGLLGLAVVLLLRHHDHNVDLYIRRAVGVALVLVAAVLLVWMLRVGNMDRGWNLTSLQGRATTVWGLLVGFCVGLTSVGSGALIAPFLMLVYPLKPARVVGTDVFHASILVGVTGLAHITAGNVDWRLVAMLLTGSVPGVVVGSRLAPRVPARFLRAALAVVLLAIGIKLV